MNAALMNPELCTRFCVACVFFECHVVGDATFFSVREGSRSIRRHGLQQGGGQGGRMPHPLEFGKDDVMCCFPVKYPKFFARAFGVRIKHT